VQKFHEITDKDSPVQMILGSTVAIILLPRDAMCKHGPCCRAMSVRLSAWVSDILELQVAAFKRLSVETNKHIFKDFTQSVSHHSSFSYQISWQYCDHDP